MQTQIQTDYDYIKNEDTLGLIKKHEGYIHHFAKVFSRYNYQEIPDIKQDLICETLDLLNWIDKTKINQNFDMKHFMFQKFNAYRKNKSSNIKVHEYSNEELQEQFESTDKIELNFFLKKEFPAILTKQERNIFFKKYIEHKKINEIAKEMKICRAWVSHHVVSIKEKFKEYMQ